MAGSKQSRWFKKSEPGRWLIRTAEKSDDAIEKALRPMVERAIRGVLRGDGGTQRIERGSPAPPRDPYAIGEPTDSVERVGVEYEKPGDVETFAKDGAEVRKTGASLGDALRSAPRRGGGPPKS